MHKFCVLVLCVALLAQTCLQDPEMEPSAGLEGQGGPMEGHKKEVPGHLPDRPV